MKAPVLSDTRVATQWDAFVAKEGLSKEQSDAFLQYLELLISWNDTMPLTTIVSPEEIIAYHFQDSLYLDRYIDFSKLQGVVDVGTGGGFPGIALAIKHPHVHYYLIEVNKKKLSFLAAVIEQLGLEDSVTLCDSDWRTFLRKTSYNVDLFVSRASLHTPELMRMFKPSCVYNKALLVYWASKDWQMSKEDEPYLVKEQEYMTKHKKRRYIFFGLRK